MGNKIQQEKVQTDFLDGSLFEEDFLVRTLGALAHSPEVALTELVANAWDAGASKVEITIPDSIGGRLVVEDDGIGMTEDQFINRWMCLGYNRTRHQGAKVEFPPGRTGNRVAYGRNGIGRHALLCFNNTYRVVTRHGGVKSDFTIATHSQNQPFVIKSKHTIKVNGFGTRLEVYVSQNRPSHDDILDIISARFIHDPSFSVIINGRSLSLEEHKGLIGSQKIIVNDKITLNVSFLDSSAVARKTLYQGIAFWQGGRLVGEPSWILGKEPVLDGRTRYAKRYTVVVKTDDLAQYVSSDWTGFIKHPDMDLVYHDVAKYVCGKFGEIARANLSETKENIKNFYKDEIKNLSSLGRYEIDEVIEDISITYPMIREEQISIAVEAVIKLEKTRSGQELLNRLTTLSEDDIEGLNRLLKQWTVKDALCVLDEIDRRISIIEAISKLSKDKTINELNVLHPLITEAKWVFGPEFDSPEYTSNQQLKTMAKELFKVDIDAEIVENTKRRPDLVVKDNFSYSLTATESFDPESEQSVISKILLVELKKGGSELNGKNREQINGYIDAIRSSGILAGSKPYIYAILIGHSVSPKMTSGITKSDNTELRIVTFSQLVDTARRRLFRLRDKLGERYDKMSGSEAANSVGIQTEMNLKFDTSVALEN